MDMTFPQLLEGYSDLFTRMIDSEVQKVSTISRQDLPGLEAAMRRDEIFSMELRSLEHKRTAWQTRHGLPDTPVDDLLCALPPEQTGQAKEALSRLRRLYHAYTQHSQSSRQFLALRLQSIDSALRQTQGSAPSAAPMTSTRG